MVSRRRKRKPRWENVLCCSGLQYLPHDPKYKNAPPSPESVNHLDLILKLGGSLPWDKDDPVTPLLLKEDHYHEGIISVARFGEPSDKHVPVRFFAAWAVGDGTLGGFAEIDKEKIDLAQEQGILEHANLPKNDRFYGKCPKHPKLEFYVRFHPLKEKPMFKWEKDPKEKGKKYPWKEGETGKSTRNPQQASSHNQAVSAEVSNEIFEPKIWEDIGFDGDDCPAPLTFFEFPTLNNYDHEVGEDDDCTVPLTFFEFPTLNNYDHEVGEDDDWITKLDFGSWPE
ncbi:hypothetical protein BGZ57DRAFT_297134 [Hyaloscypha finlandica]|nr:hypothetical protein BGZ57DRAFT_297134 [Hyaloscypha finlandica]